MRNLKIYQNFNISRFSTFKIGGKAEFFCMPESFKEIQDAISFAEKNNLKIYIIGGGANILFSDGLLNGLIISTKKLNKCCIENNFVTADSGISIDQLNKSVIKKSLSGLEFSSGLPGTLGGAVYMNARAYGKELADIVENVNVLDKKNRKIIDLKKQNLGFSYKKSVFMENPDYIIVSAVLKLSKGIKKVIKELYKKNKKDRIAKRQFEFPSAGCVFQNDYEKNIVTGRLIEELGLKGFKIGGAEISMHHGNFIINKDRAKAAHVKELIEYIEKIVYEKKGIELKREIRLLGF